MEFLLRCNDLKCRAQLHDQAVATTCSHIFCAQCADATGLSRSLNTTRLCPACGTQLANPDDVVLAGLNPSEAYKSSLLSGLSPSIIMEIASRGLAFYSYQASQEIIYEEHLAKSLTGKITNLNQQVDQLVNDANLQIKTLQDKIQTMQDEQAELEEKNHELGDAYREKSRAQQHIYKLYQSLKAQVMATHVANAAGDEADFVLHSTRGDRYVDRLPGTRSGTVNLSQTGPTQHNGGIRHHDRVGSGSSGSSGQQKGGIGLAQQWDSHLQGRALGSRVHVGNPTSVRTSLETQARHSRLPILGGTRQNTLLSVDNGPSYQASPMARQPLGAGGHRNVSNFGYRTKSKRTSMTANLGRLDR